MAIFIAGSTGSNRRLALGADGKESPKPSNAEA